MCTENPFRLTPPAAQANLNVKSNGDNANAASAASEHSTQHKSTQQNYPDPSFSDIFSAFSEAFTQRKAQGLAFLELTNSELMLIKKSFFVTVFACLAAFAVGTVCWLILNIAIGAILHSVLTIVSGHEADSETMTTIGINSALLKPVTKDDLASVVG